MNGPLYRVPFEWDYPFKISIVFNIIFGVCVIILFYIDLIIKLFKKTKNEDIYNKIMTLDEHKKIYKKIY